MGKNKDISIETRFARQCLANFRKDSCMDNEVLIPQDLISQIREIMNTARYNVAREVNNEQLLAYWNIGRVKKINRLDS